MGFPPPLTEPAPPNPNLRGLLRQQWPLILFFGCLLTFSGYASLQQGPAGTLDALSAALTALFAVVAPRRPVQAALLGALSIVAVVPVAEDAFRDGLEAAVAGNLGVKLAAAMVLSAYVVRFSGRRVAWWCVGALTAALSVVITVSGGPGGERGLTTLFQFSPIGALLLVVSVVTGLYFRSRDSERRHSVSQEVSAAQQAERMALARELHDVVAHHVTGIVVQAQAARVVAADNPEVALRALELIERSGVESLAAMRRLVGTMRGAPAAGSSNATEQATTDLDADLRRLTVDAARNGIPVTLEMDQLQPVPPELGRSVLRLVQEAMTNSGKHAAALTSVVVRVVERDGGLEVRVTDDGRGKAEKPVGGSGGYGLVGMRERVELLGGQFESGPGDYGGWRVWAWLPIRADNDSDA
ncbi:sensor histidine kinase [Actinoalloteichus spitiensis]|uniref:sensor histidine kinase n=1 Tax=Actinoalloteichus spitiensis TaxID=252394 RepID=UPI000362533F|nr:histidine kinase [Actinoalloteichus spitiensis]